MMQTPIALPWPNLTMDKDGVTIHNWRIRKLMPEYWSHGVLELGFFVLPALDEWGRGRQWSNEGALAQPLTREAIVLSVLYIEVYIKVYLKKTYCWNITFLIVQIKKLKLREGQRLAQGASQWKGKSWIRPHDTQASACPTVCWCLRKCHTVPVSRLPQHQFGRNHGRGDLPSPPVPLMGSRSIHSPWWNPPHAKHHTSLRGDNQAAPTWTGSRARLYMCEEKSSFFSVEIKDSFIQ